MEKHLRTGRPLGDEGFVKELERHLGRILLPRKPGPGVQAEGPSQEKISVMSPEPYAGRVVLALRQHAVLQELSDIHQQPQLALGG
ncbi:MAG: hypothetical protein IH945_08375, partial [Armatimonadetes bacterium]|nr:hypothetical protein [Armatimonadota bacterium]